MKIKRNWFDNAIEILCVMMLIGICVYLFVKWDGLPDQIPAHYNLKGEVNRWGSKGELLFLPIIGWVLYIGMTVVEAFPQIWNVGVTITDENRERVYRLLKTMLGVTKLLMVVLFTLIEINSIGGGNLPWYATLLFLGAIFGELIFFILRLTRIK